MGIVGRISLVFSRSNENPQGFGCRKLTFVKFLKINHLSLAGYQFDQVVQKLVILDMPGTGKGTKPRRLVLLH